MARSEAITSRKAIATAAAMANSGFTPASSPTGAANPATISGQTHLGQSALTAMWRLAYPPRSALAASAGGRSRSPFEGASE